MRAFWEHIRLKPKVKFLISSVALISLIGAANTRQIQTRKNRSQTINYRCLTTNQIKAHYKENHDNAHENRYLPSLNKAIILITLPTAWIANIYRHFPHIFPLPLRSLFFVVLKQAVLFHYRARKLFDWDYFHRDSTTPSLLKYSCPSVAVNTDSFNTLLDCSKVQIKFLTFIFIILSVFNCSEAKTKDSKSLLSNMVR